MVACQVTKRSKFCARKRVFKIKRNKHGAVEEYKARFVAKGFAQIEGCSHFRLVFVLAAQHDLHLEQLDVESAFPHEKIDKEMYFEQPEGYQEKRGWPKTSVQAK